MSFLFYAVVLAAPTEGPELVRTSECRDEILTLIEAGTEDALILDHLFQTAPRLGRTMREHELDALVRLVGPEEGSLVSSKVWSILSKLGVFEASEEVNFVFQVRYLIKDFLERAYGRNVDTPLGLSHREYGALNQLLSDAPRGRRHGKPRKLNHHAVSALTKLRIYLGPEFIRPNFHDVLVFLGRDVQHSYINRQPRGRGPVYRPPTPGANR